MGAHPKATSLVGTLFLDDPMGTGRLAGRAEGSGWRHFPVGCVGVWESVYECGLTKRGIAKNRDRDDHVVGRAHDGGAAVRAGATCLRKPVGVVGVGGVRQGVA